MTDLQFAAIYQCLPIRCSGRLMSLQNEHSVHAVQLFTVLFLLLAKI
jgi:hypothetical protein